MSCLGVGVGDHVQEQLGPYGGTYSSPSGRQSPSAVQVAAVTRTRGEGTGRGSKGLCKLASYPGVTNASGLQEMSHQLQDGWGWCHHVNFRISAEIVIGHSMHTL